MESTEPHFKRFVFIIIDGAPYEIFKGLLENGDLPNIKKYVVDRGSLNKRFLSFHQHRSRLHPFLHGVISRYSKYPGDSMAIEIRISRATSFQTSWHLQLYGN